MRFLVPVLLVIVVGFVFLAYIWMSSRRKEPDHTTSTLRSLKEEINLQITAQQPDLYHLRDLITANEAATGRRLDSAPRTDR